MSWEPSNLCYLFCYAWSAYCGIVAGRRATARRQSFDQAIRYGLVRMVPGMLLFLFLDYAWSLQ